MEINKTRISRRQFLKLAGMTGAATLLPTAFGGYQILDGVTGDLPPQQTPYVPLNEQIRLHDGESAGALLLLLTNAKALNPFGLFLAEILQAEGLNAFRVADLSDAREDVLAKFSVVILAEGPVSQKQSDLLAGYVGRGGRLIALRPDPRLAALFGLRRQPGTVEGGYLWAAENSLTNQDEAWSALQFHGAADRYELDGAEAVAWLGSEPQTAASHPAVTHFRFGQGQALAWTFDLARSVIYLRQGNPAWAGQERDGRDGLRAHDAFVDWFDPDRIAVPQADEQMRLFSTSIVRLLDDHLPLPRLWYFPDAGETMLIATGDAHQNLAFPIEDVLKRVEGYGGRMTIYYEPTLIADMHRAIRKTRWWVESLPLLDKMIGNPYPLPTLSHVADWRMRGHEFALHPLVEQGIEAGYQRYWKEFTGLGYNPVPPTMRTHRVLWQGWVETARIQASWGIRLNADYYHVGPTFQNRSGESVYGHFTGSGLPMRFVDEVGQVLNIYQQLTQLVDEHLLKDLGGWAGLLSDEAIEVSELLLSRSLKGTYSAIMTQFHIDPFANGGLGAVEAGRWLEGTLAYAAANNIPIWSAQDWLFFTEARQAADFREINWQADEGRLGFKLVGPPPPHGRLTAMLPLWHNGQQLAEVVVNGNKVEHQPRRLAGIDYGWFAVAANQSEVIATYV